jgi:hypothetical protein
MRLSASDSTAVSAVGDTYDFLTSTYMLFRVVQRISAAYPTATSASGFLFCSCGTSQSNRTYTQKLRLVCLPLTRISTRLSLVAGRAVSRRVGHHLLKSSVECISASRELLILLGRGLLINKEEPQTATFPAILLGAKGNLGCKHQRQGCPAMRPKPIRSTTSDYMVASGTAAVRSRPFTCSQLHKRACRIGNAGLAAL